jgi:hypothetical protein
MAYSSYERKIAELLAYAPGLKTGLKRVYLGLNQIFFRSRVKRDSLLPVKEVGPENQESFFGYYDKSPLSSSGHILCHLSSSNTKKKPETKSIVEVALFDRDVLSKPLLRIPVKAFNWQQGARLQWISSEKFLFNDFDEDRQKYISRVYSKESQKQEKAFDFPVQDAYGEDYFISLNYSRLTAFASDYGYHCLPPYSDSQQKELGNDGLWKVDYCSGQAELLYSFEDVLKCGEDSSFENARHSLNHVMIAPDGEKFIFLHRYFIHGVKHHRLLLGFRDKKPLKLLWNSGIISHCCWMGANTIIAYMTGPAGKNGYYRMNVESKEVVSVLEGKLDVYGDGHPGIYGDSLLTDTYPDRRGIQSLFLCNLQSGEIKTLGRFFHSVKYYGFTRCDLHPRFSPCGSFVMFDSVSMGKRRLCVMDISDLKHSMER